MTKKTTKSRERIRVFRGERLQRTRKEQGKTQEDLALALGVEVGLISKYETNKNDPSPYMLVRLAEQLDVSIDYLLGLVNEPRAILSEQELTDQERFLLETFRSKFNKPSNE